MAGHIRSSVTLQWALELSRAGLPDRRIAEVTGASVATVARWRQRYRPGGAPRCGGLAACPACEESALSAKPYSELLGVYLGAGYIARTKNRSWLLALFQDRRYPGLVARWQGPHG